MSVPTLPLAAFVLGCWLQASAPVALRVVSPNGRFVAEAIPQASITEPKNGVRCDLTVYELREGGERVRQWNGLYDYRGREAGHFLADDGSAFVHVDERYSEEGPLVRVIRRGLGLAALDARALQIADLRPASPAGGETNPTFHGTPRASSTGPAGEPGSGNAPRWIDLAPEFVRMRSVATITNTSRYLDVLGRDGILRSLDLSSGALVISTAPGLAGEPRIERALAGGATSGLEPPFVQSISAPPMVFADEGLSIDLGGSYPTPGWELQGFALETDAREPERLRITPLAKPQSEIAAQVLRPFRATAKVGGLSLGTYTIAAHGRDHSPPVADVRVTVVPSGVVMMMSHTSAGSTRTVALLADGRCIVLGDRKIPGRVVLAPVAAAAEIARRVSALDPSSASIGAEPPQDGAYEFIWVASGKLLRRARAEEKIEAPLRELAAKLEALALTGPVRHSIDGASSRLAVHTSSAGLLAAFGHDHTIAAREFEGHIDLTPGDFEHAELEITVRADSLAVVDEESQKDRAEIEQAMREHVLETARYPSIHFKSTRVSTRPLGPRTREVSITGELELHGVKKEITIDGRIGIDEGEIQARGEFSLRQSEFGIHPTSAVGGTVKVDDKLKLEFDLRARR